MKKGKDERKVKGTIYGEGLQGELVKPDTVQAFWQPLGWFGRRKK